MRRYLPFLVIVVSMLVTLPAVLAQETSKIGIAVIDVDQLVRDSASGKESLGRLQRLDQQKQAEGRKLVEGQEALQKQLSTQGATLSDAKRAELQKQIEDKQVELQRFSDDAQQQLEEAKRKELGALEKQIMPIVQEIGREMKLQLIFNKFQSGLLYADEAVDITELALRRFNTRVTTAAPATVPVPGKK